MPATLDQTSALDALFTDYDRDDGPGVAVGVLRDGEIIYRRAFGLASVEHGVPNTLSTRFDAGSITKQFTALAILMLARDGALDLDDDVRTVIPELPQYDPPVRIRHCLYHTSGLNDWIAALEFSGPFTDYCLPKRVLRTLYSLDDVLFPAGQGHSYSNTGYVLLAKIVARVSGSSLPKYLKQHLFRPLGMLRSGFVSDPEAFVTDQAQGYYPTDEGAFHRTFWPNGVHGDGAMLTSVDDMLAWLRHIDSLQAQGNDLLNDLFTPGSLDDGRPLRYAAGLELDCYRGIDAVRHGGATAGFQAHVVWFPEPRLGAVILGNVRPCYPWPASNRIADACIPGLLPQSAKQAVDNDPGAIAGADREDIAGRYFSECGLPVSVSVGSAGLALASGFIQSPLRETAIDVFESAKDGETFFFHRDAAGVVTHMTTDIEDGSCPRYYSALTYADRFESVTLSDGELCCYSGRYLCDALDTVYTIVSESGGLVARHLRCHDWHLRPIRPSASYTFHDQFTASRDWPGLITFERNSCKTFSGFRVRSAQVNLFFRRLAP